MFVDVLALIVGPDEVELLLRLSEREWSIEELSRSLHLAHTEVESKIHSLFVRGFLKKRKNGEVHYSIKSFEKIVDRYVSEGKGEVLGEYVAALANYNLAEHVKQGRANPHPGGKVLPVLEAILEPDSIILPYKTALNVLENARSFSLRDCDCRMAYKNCDNPLRTCLGLNEFSDELVERRVAETISFEEAKRVLQLANKNGLVHQVLYTDWLKGEVFDICSCCSCCCVYLRTLMDYGVKHHIAKSGLIAQVDTNKCDGCGTCVERCVFHARDFENGNYVVVKENCYGCGLCTTSCPAGATKLVSETS